MKVTLLKLNTPFYTETKERANKTEVIPINDLNNLYPFGQYCRVHRVFKTRTFDLVNSSERIFEEVNKERIYDQIKQFIILGCIQYDLYTVIYEDEDEKTKFIIPTDKLLSIYVKDLKPKVLNTRDALFEAIVKRSILCK